MSNAPTIPMVTYDIAQAKGWGKDLDQTIQGFLGSKATAQHLERLVEALRYGLTGKPALELISSYQRADVTKPGLYRALIAVQDAIAQGKPAPSSQAPSAQPTPPEQPAQVVPPPMPVVQTPVLPPPDVVAPPTFIAPPIQAQAVQDAGHYLKPEVFSTLAFNNLACSICGKPQRVSPFGAVCEAGHFGIAGMVVQAPAAQPAAPPVVPVVIPPQPPVVQTPVAPATKPDEGGNGFRRNSSGWIFLQVLRDGVARTRAEVVAIAQKLYPELSADVFEKCHANSWSTFFTQMSGERSSMEGWNWRIQKLSVPDQKANKFQVSGNKADVPAQPVAPAATVPAHPVHPTVPTAPAVVEEQFLASPPPPVIPTAPMAPGIYHTPEATRIVGPLDVSCPQSAQPDPAFQVGGQMPTELLRLTEEEAKLLAAYRQAAARCRVANARLEQIRDEYGKATADAEDARLNLADLGDRFEKLICA